MGQPYRVLFLCRANSARSIMAQALLRELGDGKFESYSAGVEPAHSVHELALAQLRPTIRDLDNLQPKSWDTYSAAHAPRMDVIIALCDEASERHAPAFPGHPVFCQWVFPDPLAETGSVEEQKRAFEKVFRQLLRRLSIFVALPLHAMKASEQIKAVNAMDAGAHPQPLVTPA